jgi:hypothetical protein
MLETSDLKRNSKIDKVINRFKILIYTLASFIIWWIVIGKNNQVRDVESGFLLVKEAGSRERF